MSRSLKRNFAAQFASPAALARRFGNDAVEDPHPTGGKPGSTAEDAGKEEDEKQRIARERAEKSKKKAQEGTPVQSPGSEPGTAIGPMGDGSNNAGDKMSRQAIEDQLRGQPVGGVARFARGLERQIAVNQVMGPDFLTRPPIRK